MTRTYRQPAPTPRHSFPLWLVSVRVPVRGIGIGMGINAIGGDPAGLMRSCKSATRLS